jgi:hypothetical protein
MCGLINLVLIKDEAFNYELWNDFKNSFCKKRIYDCT